MLNLDQFDPIEEIVVPLGEYFFHSETKAMIKRRSKKRKIDVLEEEYSQQSIIWHAIGIFPDEVAQETTSTLGTFAHVNKRSTNEVIVEIEKKKTQATELEEKLTVKNQY
jgi:hypothetical protein